ncbi:MAG: hypothetical protein M3P84_10125 [Chloroflexota bacterium]|nr:hypothetical protein [Chloroflexota bacterium]
MPFDFLKKNKPPADDPAPPTGPEVPTITAKGMAFDGLTEEWRLVGAMQIDGRLSDVLNRRESIPISDVSWAPIDGSEPFSPAPGLKTVDPYDLIVVLAGEHTLPLMTEDDKAAHRIHKISYDLALEVPPFRVVGTVFLFPGSEPERLLDRATEMFVPVTDAVAYYGDERIGGTEVDTFLVNRRYLRGVEQVDRRNRGELGREQR